MKGNLVCIFIFFIDKSYSSDQNANYDDGRTWRDKWLHMHKLSITPQFSVVLHRICISFYKLFSIKKFQGSWYLIALPYCFNNQVLAWKSIIFLFCCFFNSFPVNKPQNLHRHTIFRIISKNKKLIRLQLQTSFLNLHRCTYARSYSVGRH